MLKKVLSQEPSFSHHYTAGDKILIITHLHKLKMIIFTWHFKINIFKPTNKLLRSEVPKDVLESILENGPERLSRNA